MDAEPIRIRVYGLFRMTRRSYLIIQGMVGLVLVAAILWWLLSGFVNNWPNIWLLRNLHWLIAAVLVYETLETYFVLSAFHMKQRIAERSRRR
jgi:hypothetical protein